MPKLLEPIRVKKESVEQFYEAFVAQLAELITQRASLSEEDRPMHDAKIDVLTEKFAEFKECFGIVVSEQGRAKRPPILS